MPLDRLRYRSIYFVTRLLGRLRKRLTPAGWLILTALISSGLFGLDTSRSMSFQTFSFLAALFLGAAAAGLMFRTPFRVERRLPRCGTVGENLPYMVTIRNRGAAVEEGLQAAEDLAPPPPSFESFRTAGGPADRQAALVERLSGYSRWRRLYRERDEPARRELPDLAPGEACEIAMELRPAGRGRLRLKGIDVFRTGPFGLLRSFRNHSLEQSVLVLPKRYPVPRIELPGKRMHQQGGVALASSVGDSQEFFSLRDYRPGDPLRRVHWKSWAKTGRLVVKQFQDEYFVRHALVLDTFGPEGEAFEEAVSVAASLAASMLTQESLLDLLFVADQCHRFTAGRGLGGTEKVLEVLAGVRPPRAGRFADLENSILSLAGLISGCVLVLLGYDQVRRSLVRTLRERGLPVLVLVVDGRDSASIKERGVYRLQPGRIPEGLARIEARGGGW